jgi:O-antigen/teichoic acid export membrane protein
LSARPLIELLYPSGFHEAGWMLQLLAVAAIPQVLTVSSWYAFFALGRSFVPMSLQAVKLALKGVAMLVGCQLAGPRGVILGLLAAELVHYPFVALALHRHRLFQPALDVPVLLLSLWLAGLQCC